MTCHPLLNPPDGRSVIQSWEETDGHRPESQTPAGWYDGCVGVGSCELWGRPERRTDRGKRYIFVSFCISRLTLQNGSSHSTLPKLMRCFAKLKDSWRLHLSLSCHGLFFRSYFCRYDIPFTHSWSVLFPPFLSVTTGCWLVSLFCSLCFTFHSFLSITPQDVITPTDV